MHLTSWPMWAAVLFLQNISFTYVSRARSSGSLLRHLKASIFSNGIWIFSNMLMLGPLFDYLTGKHGLLAQVITGLIYTASCVSGSIFAHHLAMKTEKGKNAVGYSAKYAQIPVEEWEAMKKYAPITAADWQAIKSAVLEFQKLPTVEELIRVRKLAEAAYTISVDTLPDSGVSAQKFAGKVVTTGLASNKS